MKSKLFQLWCLIATGGLFAIVTFIIGFILYRGVPTLSLNLFFGDTPAYLGIFGLSPIWDGIWPACLGTLSVVLGALLIALLPGIATGIWLAINKRSPFHTLLSLSIDILAGIPSVLMGLFGFTLILLLRQTLFPSANNSLLLSALCLAMLIIPYLAAATRSALQALPSSLTICALRLGMSQWQTLWYVLLPEAGKGIKAGVMLATGRAAEDTAVIMLTGAVASVGLPGGIFERYEALPFTIFYYSAQYQSVSELQMAFGAALTLLCITATLFAMVDKVQRPRLNDSSNTHIKSTL